MNRNDAALEIVKAIIMGPYQQNQDIVHEANKAGIPVAQAIATSAFEFVDAVIEQGKT